MGLLKLYALGYFDDEEEQIEDDAPQPPPEIEHLEPQVEEQPKEENQISIVETKVEPKVVKFADTPEISPPKPDLTAQEKKEQRKAKRREKANKQASPPPPPPVRQIVPEPKAEGFTTREVLIS